MGFITQGHGVTVHRADCPQLLTHKIEEERWILVEWGYHTHHEYPVDIVISSEDKEHILKEVTTFFSQEKLSVTSIHSMKHENDNMALVYLTFEISDLSQLHKTLSKMRRLPKVLSVQRR
jgi:GTP pyrophosphokinase